jgi:hypothetical protein
LSVPAEAAVNIVTALAVVTEPDHASGEALVPLPLAVANTPEAAFVRLSAPGVAALLAAVYAPVPTALTAATRKTYAVPLVSPVTVALVAVDVPSENVVHVLPLSLESCKT